MSIPKSLRIHGRDWTIELTEEGLRDDRLTGDTTYRLQRLRVRRDMPAQHQAETVIHESLHAIGDAFTGTNDDKLSLTEDQVRLFGTLLYQVLADNPDLLRFILEVNGHSIATPSDGHAPLPQNTQEYIDAFKQKGS